MKMLIILLLLLMLIFNNINARGKGYTLYKDFFGSNDYIIAISDTGDIGICKY